MIKQIRQKRLGDGFYCLMHEKRNKQADFGSMLQGGTCHGTQRTGGRYSWGRGDKGHYCNLYMGQ